MPTIKENQLSGKIISYRFTVCLGRDQAGKQIRKTTTWRPPEGTTPSKARKMAEQEAKRWELSLTEEEPPAPPPPPEPEQRKDDFVKFIDSVWFPLAIEGSERKPKTVSAYKSYLKIEDAYFRGKSVQEITSIDIQQFLRYLRKEYHGIHGVGLKPKTVHHHYNLLNLIFAYAKEQQLISDNPMDRVKSPKKDKRPVDAFTKEQAKQFLTLLEGAELDFRCMMLLLLTTEMRRGELCGL